ncbi:MAG: hypothetical protein ABIO02_00030 [Patescibacteria group bacterium]
MPQRTKKEKQAAQQRKAVRYTIVESADEPKTASPKKMLHVEKNLKFQSSEEDIAIKTYFLQDLRKSIVFIVCILGLELFLHFVRISNYFLR